MKKVIKAGKGTPEQFLEALENRLDELGASADLDIDACKVITASAYYEGSDKDLIELRNKASKLGYDVDDARVEKTLNNIIEFIDIMKKDMRWYDLENYLFEHDLAELLSDSIDDDDELQGWQKLASKEIIDFDGFITDYSLWYNPYSKDDKYVCIYGDDELYTPLTADPDFSCETEQEAWEWFEDYDTGEMEGEDYDY